MIVSFREVSKHYRTGEGISDVSFSIARGEVVGLLGLNGSGKTTTMKIISGLLRPEKGSITINGKQPRQGRHHVAFLGDRQGFPLWMKPEDMEKFLFAFFRDFNPDLFRQLATELEVPPKPLGEMSKGQQQKIKLIGTMARKADIYLLDEPLSGIDIVARKGILQTLMQAWRQESSIVIATHEIQDIDPFLSRGLFLTKGRILADESTASIREADKSVADRFIELMEETKS